MNILFFSIASFLVLIAFAFILPPLWRRYPVATVANLPDDQDQRNILIARHRLAELKEQHQAGALTQSQYDEQFAELELALSDDLDIISHVAVSRSEGRWAVTVLAVMIPLAAGLLYFTLGNIPAISHTEELAKADPEAPSAADINKMVEGLAERLKSNPDDAKGWVMLGRSYQQLEQFPKAVDAFANAYRLLGDKAEIMLLYAESLAFANNQSLLGKSAELIEKSLALEPENMNALWLGGLLKVQQNNPQGAVQLWRKLETLLPPGSDAQKQIQGVIADMGGPANTGPAQSEVTKSENTSGVNIAVEVSLTPELQKSVNPGDTVFIYAQALTGPKMPLAIVRKQVSDLPLSVSLDDTMAMMPAMKLSNFSQVKLLARISKSGNAMAQPGDLLGSLEQVALSDSRPHKIIINGVVK
ncbi:MAG: c-type cytochrome biogenesis protein CcmI [Methylococcaceae bacterium]|nr:c-type cytochrome biogenesis protein CcmI [Methylococcaceae bacterium]